MSGTEGFCECRLPLWLCTCPIYPELWENLCEGGIFQTKHDHHNGVIYKFVPWFVSRSGMYFVTWQILWSSVGMYDGEWRNEFQYISALMSLGGNWQEDKQQNSTAFAGIAAVYAHVCLCVRIKKYYILLVNSVIL